MIVKYIAKNASQAIDLVKFENNFRNYNGHRFRLKSLKRNLLSFNTTYQKRAHDLQIKNRSYINYQKSNGYIKRKI